LQQADHSRFGDGLGVVAAAYSDARGKYIDSSSPLAGMRSPVKMNYFAVYEGSGF
jgi:hypothetical protein